MVRVKVEGVDRLCAVVYVLKHSTHKGIYVRGARDADKHCQPLQPTSIIDHEGIQKVASQCIFLHDIGFEFVDTLSFVCLYFVCISLSRYTLI
jgi:hypothetical protein